MKSSLLAVDLKNLSESTGNQCAEVMKIYDSDIILKKYQVKQPDEIMKIAVKAKSDFYQCLVLLLKNEWESHLINNIGEDWEVIADSGYENINIAEWKNKFNPDTNSLYKTFRRYGSKVKLGNYSKANFYMLVQEMILVDLHIAALGCPEVENFILRKKKSDNILKNCTLEEKENFWEIKSTWLQHQNTLEDLLLVLEQCRLHNAHVDWEFLFKFGENYLKLKMAIMRNDLIKLKMELQEVMQFSKLNDLEELILEVQKNMEVKLEELRTKIAFAPIHYKSDLGVALSISDESNYRRKAKKLLRKIWRLVHPDILANDSSYQKMTESQKQKLAQLWAQAMKIRPEEVGFTEAQFGYNYRSIVVLEEILEQIKNIFKYAGLDIDPNLIIHGDTVSKQTEWLKKAIEKQDAEISFVHAEIKVLMEDRETIEKRRVLDVPEDQQQDIADGMLLEAKNLNLTSEKLEKELMAMIDSHGSS